MEGDELGSACLMFEPRPVTGGDFHFVIDTAGSSTLVLQTVLPALLIAENPSNLVLEGGTHNPWAPPFEFLQRVFVPLLQRMGPRVSLELDRYGFYPAGGGRFRARVEPTDSLRGFDLLERGSLVSRSVEVLLAKLPRHIAERELRTVLEALGWEAECAQIRNVDSIGPGNTVTVELVHHHLSERFTAFGRKGVPAEQVARDVVDEVRSYLSRDVAVGRYLADQWLLPLGISAWQRGAVDPGSGGAFRTLPPTTHTTTQIEILRRFLAIPIDVIVEQAAMPVASEHQGGRAVIRVGSRASSA
jgi:RNA 3'-terminal phosphate cyclase (ATP)